MSVARWNEWQCTQSVLYLVLNKLRITVKKKEKQNKTKQTHEQKDKKWEPTFLEDYHYLAKFMRTLPPKSMRHIWEYSVNIKTGSGKEALAETQTEQQIAALLKTCVGAYIKVMCVVQRVHNNFHCFLYFLFFDCIYFFFFVPFVLLCFVYKKAQAKQIDKYTVLRHNKGSTVCKSRIPNSEPCGKMDL